MFDRFTDRARRIMGLSRQEAQRFKHDYIGVEHLFLALLRESEGVGALALRGLGMDLEHLSASVKATMLPGETQVTMGQLPFTPGAKRCLENSLAEATMLGDTYIGSQHLLLGLLRCDETEPAKALQEAGVSLDALRQAVRDVEVARHEEAAAAAPFTREEPPPRALLLQRLDEVEAVLTELRSEVERLRHLLEDEQSED